MEILLNNNEALLYNGEVVVVGNTSGNILPIKGKFEDNGVYYAPDGKAYVEVNVAYPYERKLKEFQDTKIEGDY